MSDEVLSRVRHGDAWRRSELNQRERLRGFRSRRSATGRRSSKPSPGRRRPSCSTGEVG